MMARPAVNPPREEPVHHWRYDCTTRLFDLVPGRRPAGYVVASEDSRTIDAPAPCFLRRGLLLGGRRQIVHRDAEGIGDVAQRLHGSGRAGSRAARRIRTRREGTAAADRSRIRRIWRLRRRLGRICCSRFLSSVHAILIRGLRFGADRRTAGFARHPVRFRVFGVSPSA